MQATLALLAFFSIGSVSLLMTLIGFIALLSILRRVRISRVHGLGTHDVYASQPQIKTGALETREIQVITPVNTAPPIIPTVRTMVSEQVTIMIEPDENHFIQRNRLQRANLQRLISHLKTIDTLKTKAG
jgi:hypothetical protein